MSDEYYECVILLVYVEEPATWTPEALQVGIGNILELVNDASDLTGIYAAGLFLDRWGEDAVASFFVQHDHRYDSFEQADTMIADTFSKAIELCELDEQFWVMDEDERSYLEPGP